MKITDLTLYKVPPRWLFLKISTDEGIDGWGEPVIEGRADTVRTAVEEFRNYLIGKDPANIEDHWQVMYRCGFYRGGPEVMSAIAGIDQALWDIKGKKLGVPVYELLGGACRDKLRVYRWIGGDRPSDIKANVLEAKAQGYSAIKMNATEEMHYIDSFKKIDAVCERVAIIRDTLGMDMDIAVDFHGRVHKTMARVLAKELDQFHLMFIEEPVLSQNNEAMRDIRQATCTPIATGERMFSRWEFKICWKQAMWISSSPIFPMRAVSASARRLQRWQKPTMWLLRRIARLARLPSARAFSWIPARLTHLFRSRVSASTITRAATCWIIWQMRASMNITKALWACSRVRVLA